ncbi:hypothetical protein C8Q70DRAFT_1055040 [Cubamyces menziesii]|nr:hypothetical protein C8Q70DRAFT_1055040 [Cubamyces menziesii]
MSIDLNPKRQASTVSRPLAALGEVKEKEAYNLKPSRGTSNRSRRRDMMDVQSIAMGIGRGIGVGVGVGVGIGVPGVGIRFVDAAEGGTTPATGEHVLHVGATILFRPRSCG